MSTLLVAHGTRNPHGVAMIGDLAAAMSGRLGHRVRTAFVDVLGPDPAHVLAQLLADEPVTVVPAFLARGYHVRADLPEQLRQAARARGVTLSESLGPSPLLADALADRLREAGARRHDAVVLAAAGSSDPQAVADVRRTARLLSARLGTPVTIAFAAPPAGSPHPGVAEAVSTLRRRHRRIAVASYLLADGLFQGRLHESGAQVVAAPLGVHPRVVELACLRAGAHGDVRRVQTASR